MLFRIELNLFSLGFVLYTIRSTSLRKFRITSSYRRTDFFLQVSRYCTISQYQVQSYNVRQIEIEIQCFIAEQKHDWVLYIYYLPILFLPTETYNEFKVSLQFINVIIIIYRWFSSKHKKHLFFLAMYQDLSYEKEIQHQRNNFLLARIYRSNEKDSRMSK